MNRFNRISSSANQGNHSVGLWLLVGLLLLPFTTIQTVIPLAAWLAPIFLLRYSRTARRAVVALPLIFVAYAVGIIIATRGVAFSDLALAILGLFQLPVPKGLMYTLPYAADRVVGSRLKGWARPFIFPLAFTTVDWLMSLFQLTNSTGSPAYSQYDNLALLQILSLTGMWGITFLIAWCASTVNELWEHQFDWRPVRGMAGVFVGVLLAAILFGSARLAFTLPLSQTVQAATITLGNAAELEANTAIGTSFDQTSEAQRAAVRPHLEQTTNLMLSRTETALRGGAKIVTWSEGAGVLLEEDKQNVLDRAAALARQYNAYLQISVAVLTRTPRPRYLLNQSVLVDPTGMVLWTYDKTYPVIPIEWSYMIPGPGRLPIADSPYGRLSTAICNDLHVPPLLRQAGQNGVDILLAPFHDGHPWEHEDAVTATYRAIENGFSLVRPAGQGFSTIVDYQGRTLASQDYFTNSTGIMMTTVPIQGVTTLYSRIGDVFAYLCAVGLIFLTGWAIIRHERPAAIPGHLPA